MRPTEPPTRRRHLPQPRAEGHRDRPVGAPAGPPGRRRVRGRRPAARGCRAPEADRPRDRPGDRRRGDRSDQGRHGLAGAHLRRAETARGHGDERLVHPDLLPPRPVEPVRGGAHRRAQRGLGSGVGEKRPWHASPSWARLRGLGDRRPAWPTWATRSSGSTSTRPKVARSRGAARCRSTSPGSRRWSQRTARPAGSSSRPTTPRPCRRRDSCSSP